MEYHILNDQDLSFKDIMKRHLSGESLVNLKEKKLYDDMRMKAATAREEMEASIPGSDRLTVSKLNPKSITH